MPILDRNSKKTLLICICIFILGGFIHASSFKIKLLIIFPSFYTFLYSGIIITWIESLSRRIIHHEVRRYLMSIGFLMLFWYFLHPLKFEYFGNSDIAQRLLWYLYYVPITLIPLMSFLASINIGKYDVADTTAVEKRRIHRLLYLPAMLIILVALTNESHHLFFRFKDPIIDWRKNYTYEIGYFITLIWVSILSLSSLFLVFYKCKISGSRKYSYLLFIPLCFGIVFLILYGLKIRGIFFLRMYKLSEIVGLMVIGIWEACIQIGLIPSNSSYSFFFEHSTISAQIIDLNRNVVYHSENSICLSKDQILSAEASPIIIEDGIKLSSKKIPGGSILWEEDISFINNLNKELEIIREKLNRENELIKTENELIMRNQKIIERNHLYDKITKSVNSEVSEITRLLNKASREQDHENLKKILSKACIYKVYIKRKSNLELLSQNGTYMPIYELENSIRESIDYLCLYGISAYIHRQKFQPFAEPFPNSCRISNEEVIRCESTILVYDLFQKIIESTLSQLTALLVNLNFNNDKVILKMNLEYSASLNLNGWNEAKFKRLNIRKIIHKEDNTTYITIYIPKGRGDI